MDEVYILAEDEVLKAQQFHLQHFPDQDVPKIGGTKVNTTNNPADPSPDDVGFYPDGTRRTLTDEQIALFRHSETQRLLVKRRRQNEAREEKEHREIERSRTKRRQNQPQPPVPTRFQSDTMIHAKNDVDKLSYEDKSEEIKNEQPQTFQWPVLGS